VRGGLNVWSLGQAGTDRSPVNIQPRGLVGRVLVGLYYCKHVSPHLFFGLAIPTARTALVAFSNSDALSAAAKASRAVCTAPALDGVNASSIIERPFETDTAALKKHELL
jgi:hypothetical protein